MSSISFDNTAIAFASKSDQDLNRSFLLFSLVARPLWVKIGKYAAYFALGLRLPVKGLIKSTIFKQFCGGENMQECDATINSLAKFNIGTILDYSVEGKESELDFNHTASETILTIEKAKSNNNIPFCVFKVTGMARFALLESVSKGASLNQSELNEWETVIERVNKICNAAFLAEIPVFIDAEESWIQPAIDQLAEQMMERYNKHNTIVYNTIQLYRTDRLLFLKSAHRIAREKGYKLGLNLVRGAYMEKERLRAQTNKSYPDPIQKDKLQTDKDYNDALEYCVNNISDIAICAGSHNENSAQLLVSLMKKKQLPANDKRIYFSQLLGMSDHISYNLAAAGYHVAKYVPYGPVKEVLPYLIRRAQENTSVKGQTGRELGLIISEKQRRKSA